MRIKSKSIQIKTLREIKNGNLKKVLKKIYTTKSSKIIANWEKMIEMTKDIKIPNYRVENIIKATHNQQKIFETMELNGFVKKQTEYLNTFVGQQMKQEYAIVKNNNVKNLIKKFENKKIDVQDESQANHEYEWESKLVIDESTNDSNEATSIENKKIDVHDESHANYECESRLVIDESKTESDEPAAIEKNNTNVIKMNEKITKTVKTQMQNEITNHDNPQTTSIKLEIIQQDQDKINKQKQIFSDGKKLIEEIYNKQKDFYEKLKQIEQHQNQKLKEMKDNINTGYQFNFVVPSHLHSSIRTELDNLRIDINNLKLYKIHVKYNTEITKLSEVYKFHNDIIIKNYKQIFDIYCMIENNLKQMVDLNLKKIRINYQKQQLAKEEQQKLEQHNLNIQKQQAQQAQQQTYQQHAATIPRLMHNDQIRIDNNLIYQNQRLHLQLNQQSTQRLFQKPLVNLNQQLHLVQNKQPLQQLNQQYHQASATQIEQNPRTHISQLNQLMAQSINLNQHINQASLLNHYPQTNQYQQINLNHHVNQAYQVNLNPQINHYETPHLVNEQSANLFCGKAQKANFTNYQAQHINNQHDENNYSKLNFSKNALADQTSRQGLKMLNINHFN